MKLKTSLIVGLGLSALLLGCTAAENADPAPSEPVQQLSVCPADAITDPGVFQWTYNSTGDYYSGTMEVGEATFNLNGESLTTRAYRQEGQAYTIPGPTMTMVPGNKYVLSFHNTLPYEAPSPEHNVFKDPNSSNIHTHGLHISGESPGDDVTRSFEGGFGGDFVYDIPADHMGGTYWYHAHHHGSTMLQVAGGMFGLIIVDDGADEIPANVATMTEREIVLGYLDPGVAGTGGDTLISGTVTAGWTVNGTRGKGMCMPANEWQHWRVLLADRNAMEKTVGVGASCEVKLLARDGVWRTTAPKDLPTNDISITGASRADFAVRCSGDSEITINGTKVADVFTIGTGDSSVHPYAADGVSMWSAKRPTYLRDLRNETGVNTETVNMGARTVNGSKFDPNEPTFALPADQVQDWSVKGAARHPFHLHVYHVQSQNCGGDFEDGEFYDVVASNCNVRFDLSNSNSTSYDGRTIMHCHILEHEDQGAMGWLDVIGGKGPPSFPAGTSFQEHYSFGDPPPVVDPPAAPSSLAAAPVSSSAIDLNWTDNAVDENGFSVERSLNGVDYAAIATVGADVSVYSDTGLSSSTSYTYRVLAYNDGGNSTYSNSASATTSAGTVATAVGLPSVTVTTVNIGQGNKVGQATIVVLDDQGGVVSNATVSGAFSGTFNESASGTTDASGTATLQTSSSAKGSVSVTYCVTSISHPDLTDWTGNQCASL